MSYITQERRYALKRYHRTADKPDCPLCGGKHRFSEYIDIRTGQPVGPGVGKCDRENHCCYRLTPREYFQQHPEARYGYRTPATPIMLPEQKPRLFLPDNVMEMYNTSYRESNFGRWMATKAPTTEVLELAAKMYHLTATRTQGVIFWYIDHRGRFCQGKMMWYNVNGHRNGIVSTISSDLAKRQIMPKDAEMERCLFGAHLLKERPSAVVYLVESEKTAIVMSMLQPDYVWLATGGCSMLNSYVVRPLVGRRVVIIPDSGCLQKWKKVMIQTKGINYTFFEDLEMYPANTDILDVILNEVKQGNSNS